MTDKRRSRTVTASLLCAGVSAIALAGSPASAQPGPEVVHVDRQALASPGQITDYWTAKRLRNAKPVGVPRLPGGSDEDQGDSAGPEGAPVAVPPRPLADEPVPQDVGDGIVPQAGLIPYTSFELTDTLSFPNRVHGKVFFTKPSTGFNYVCSGSVVNATNDSTVITAGHCVNDNGVWATNFAFVPGYRNGSAPYGVWAASNELAPQQWVQSENFSYDVGAAVMALNSSGQELEDVVGARGIAFNQPTQQHFRSHGYPAQSPFDGSKLWACESDFGFPDSPGGGADPPTMAIGCNMTGGSSGGGWVFTDDSGNGFVNSVNSYKYLNQLEVMFGPYFGDTAQAMFNQAQVQPAGTTGPSVDSTPAAVQPFPSSSPKQKCKKVKKRGKKRKRICKVIG